MSHTTYGVIDLFAGCGGLSQGFAEVDHAGRAPATFATHAAVEMNADAARTYAANHGEHVFCGDIAEWLDNSDIPAADVVIGGPPCQGFSNLGSRDVNDERNVLWRHYVRTIERVSPAMFVMENVPDFLRSSQFELLKEERRPGGMLHDYDFLPQILDASEFGAAQKRRRALLIGVRRDIGSPLLMSPRDGEAPRTVRQALEGVNEVVTEIDLPRKSGPYLTTDLHLTRRFADISLRRFQAIPEGGNRFNIPFADLAPCWRTHRSGSGDVMGRLYWDRPSVTIRTEFYKPEKGRYLHPVQHRSITHFEAALLQGFPLDYQWYGSKTSIGRQIGNAVPVPLGRAIALRVAERLVEAGVVPATSLQGRLNVA